MDGIRVSYQDSHDGSDDTEDSNDQACKAHGINLWSLSLGKKNELRLLPAIEKASCKGTPPANTAVRESISNRASPMESLPGRIGDTERTRKRGADRRRGGNEMMQEGAVPGMNPGAAPFFLPTAIARFRIFLLPGERP